MRFVNCSQGEPDWFAARLGIPTASCFDKILTAGGKPSTQAEAYMHTLLAETITGLPGGMEPNEWMQRGTEMEPEARAWYEFQASADVEQVGFVMQEGYGCSPDGLVGNNGLVEIKVPAPHTHVGYLLDGKLPTKYRPQVQGQLWVCKRGWCDFVSYAPNMPPVVIRVERDEQYIAALYERMDWFLKKLESKRKRLIDLGHIPEAA